MFFEATADRVREHKSAVPATKGRVSSVGLGLVAPFVLVVLRLRFHTTSHNGVSVASGWRKEDNVSALRIIINHYVELLNAESEGPEMEIEVPITFIRPAGRRPACSPKTRCNRNIRRSRRNRRMRTKLQLKGAKARG